MCEREGFAPSCGVHGNEQERSGDRADERVPRPRGKGLEDKPAEQHFLGKRGKQNRHELERERTGKACERLVPRRAERVDADQSQRDGYDGKRQQICRDERERPQRFPTLQHRSRGAPPHQFDCHEHRNDLDDHGGVGKPAVDVRR